MTQTSDTAWLENWQVRSAFRVAERTDLPSLFTALWEPQQLAPAESDARDAIEAERRYAAVGTTGLERYTEYSKQRRRAR